MAMAVIMPERVWCFYCSWCLIWHLASRDMNFLQNAHVDRLNKKKANCHSCSLYIPHSHFNGRFQQMWTLNTFYDYCYVLLKPMCNRFYCRNRNWGLCLCWWWIMMMDVVMREFVFFWFFVYFFSLFNRFSKLFQTVPWNIIKI